MSVNPSPRYDGYAVSTGEPGWDDFPGTAQPVLKAIAALEADPDVEMPYGALVVQIIDERLIDGPSQPPIYNSIDWLVERGFVTRHPEAIDRRTVGVTVTAAGEAMLREEMHRLANLTGATIVEERR